MNLEPYPYQPTPDDIQKFDQIWLFLWHIRFRHLDDAEYYDWKNFCFEVFITGMNQHKFDLRLDLEKSLGD